MTINIWELFITKFYIKVILVYLFLVIPLIYSCHNDNGRSGLVINEFSASNQKTIVNPLTQKYDDWIEIYNGSKNEIDLSGYFLTDNVDNPEKWMFPENTIISPDGYLLVWADGTETDLHTSFKLSKSKEEVALFSDDKILIDHIEFNNMPDDVSYGRNTDDKQQWGFFSEPTPNKANSNKQYIKKTGIVDIPSFSHKAGFYNNPISLELHNQTENSQIRYTVNGDNPNSNSSIYTKPIYIDTTTIIRALIIIDGEIEGTVITKSYFINVHKNLPIISLVADSLALWDTTFGIYSNSLRNIRRSGNFEFFTDKVSVINQEAKISISGNVARNHGQKAIRIEANSKIENNTFNHRFFPEKRVYSYNSILLREGGHPDKYETAIRDGMSQYLSVQELGLDYVGYRPAVLYINGKYWGIYNIREKVNADYINNNYNLDDNQFDMVKNGWLETIVGDNYEYIVAKEFIVDCDKSDPNNYKIASSLIDIDNYINYNILEIYVANIDWPNWNIKFWRNKTEDPRWKWILVDLDYGLGSGVEPDYNMISYSTSPIKTRATNPKVATELFRSLLEFPEFKEVFIQRFAAILNTSFSPDSVSVLIDRFKREKELEIPFHIERWKNSVYKSPWGKFDIPQTKEEWENNIDIIYDFAQKRPDAVRQNLIKKFNLKGLVDISTISNGGHIYIGEIKIPQGNFHGPFFKDIPMIIKPVPNPGYQFQNWIINGKPRSGKVLSIKPHRNSTIEAVFTPSSMTLLPDTIWKSKKLVKSKSPYYAIGDVFIKNDAVLKVEAGVSIYMENYRSIIVGGGLILDGTIEDSIIIQPNPLTNSTEWGALCIDSASSDVSLNYVSLKYGSWYDNQYKFKATITSKYSNIKINNSKIHSLYFPFYSEHGSVEITNSSFTSNRTCDLINVKYANSALVDRCYLAGNYASDVDAIDYDGVKNGIISNNVIYGFFGSNSDAIDIGESAKDVVIEGNRILNISDKGISIGQGSSAIIRNNLIYNCNMGIGIKDSNSFAYAENNVFCTNKHGIAVFEKNHNAGGGAAEVNNCLFLNSKKTPVYKDSLSHIVVSRSYSNSDSLDGIANFKIENGINNCFIDEFGAPDYDFNKFLNYSPPNNTNQTIPDIIISEVNKAPEIKGNKLMWVELYNTSDKEINLSRWTLVNEKLAIIPLPDNITIEPKGYYVLTNNKPLFDWTYPYIFNTSEIFKKDIISWCGNLRLYNEQMILIDQISYENEYLIPKAYKKVGFHIDRIDTLLNSLIDNMRLSKLKKGTPATGNW